MSYKVSLIHIFDKCYVFDKTYIQRWYAFQLAKYCEYFWKRFVKINSN